MASLHWNWASSPILSIFNPNNYKYYLKKIPLFLLPISLFSVESYYFLSFFSFHLLLGTKVYQLLYSNPFTIVTFMISLLNWILKFWFIRFFSLCIFLISSWSVLTSFFFYLAIVPFSFFLSFFPYCLNSDQYVRVCVVGLVEFFFFSFSFSTYIFLFFWSNFIWVNHLSNSLIGYCRSEEIWANRYVLLEIRSLFFFA